MEEVKYMKNGGEDDQKIAARNQENLVRIELNHFSNELTWLCVCDGICSVQHPPAPAYVRREDFLQNVTAPCKALMDGAKYDFFLLVFLN